jgi:carbon-monoxide dehydrogenase small subunit
MSEHEIRFVLNDTAQAMTVPAERLLIDLLRVDLGLTGTKLGCGIGVCGSCSVLVDGAVTTACLLPAVFVDGTEVRTVEGLADPDGRLSILQESFIRRGGFQCGICTPGQLMAATALLAESPQPSTRDVQQWLMGNLCRCTGYAQIVEALLAAADETRSSATGEARRPAPDQTRTAAADRGTAPA